MIKVSYVAVCLSGKIVGLTYTITDCPQRISSVNELFHTMARQREIMPNTHRRRRRDKTVSSRRRRQCVLG